MLASLLFFKPTTCIFTSGSLSFRNFLCLECTSARYHMAHLITIFRFLLKCCHHCEAFLDHSVHLHQLWKGGTGCWMEFLLLGPWGLWVSEGSDECEGSNSTAPPFHLCKACFEASRKSHISDKDHSVTFL